jgi:hypothetical protein
MYVRIDRINGTSRPIELADHHEQISAYVLHAGVPQEIVLPFETARNVYLYAWLFTDFTRWRSTSAWRALSWLCVSA